MVGGYLPMPDNQTLGNIIVSVGNQTHANRVLSQME